jgi:hypothetical protein
MSLKDMDKKGVTFACMNSIGETPSSLATFALKFKDTATREEFKDAVESHKDRQGTGRAPEDARELTEGSRSLKLHSGHAYLSFVRVQEGAERYLTFCYY